ncbi:hypothetical protein [Paenibacillus cymbidii]|uniref:hypothetical protein n=1 Tax=Paenibacillus cymbidii TaxID=1639034 RepID=UPI001081C0CC|nr:hypothetical protein [Paenibacillus cymbidii]
MTTAWSETIQEGDWIGGASHRDEKFLGFVQSIGPEGVVKVWVTQSDRQEIVGEMIQTKLHRVKKLPEYSPSAPEELHDLIGLSLDTHDKAWFEELTGKLQTVTAAQHGRNKTTAIQPYSWFGNGLKNRLDV